jgi:tetratricopeptide (TPR) repeat protein
MQKYRYKAFISYSHEDRQWAAWLQRSLERYRVPRRLVGKEGSFGPIPARLAPVFRDREDLSSSADLGASVKESLESSESLVVICSPTAAASKWVNEEVGYFQSLGRHDRVFALIVDGDPQAADPEQRCFPNALTVNPDGTTREPLAGDTRKWADGRLLAKLKIIAGILGIRLDDLRRRDMQRRQKLWMMSMAGATTIAMVMSVLALVAVKARHAAENRREHAEALVGYMVGDLKSKLDEVGRLDILEGVGDRVGEYLQTLDPGEVTDESLIQQAKVWRQLGEVAMNQADLPGALEGFAASRDILLELHRRNPAVALYVYELGVAEFWIGYVHLETGEFDLAEKALNDYLAWSYRLNELEPGKPEWLMEKSYAHINIAALINRRGSGDVDAALVHISKAAEFGSQVIEIEPENFTYLSEYAEVMAWLADTHLLRCDLGAALMARQEQVRISRQLAEGSPGNNELKSRYAFSLTGLSNVAVQVGLLEPALENMSEARDLIGQLSQADVRNSDLKFEHLSREFNVAEILGELGRLDEASALLERIDPGIREVLEAEAYSNRRRYTTWLEFLLVRSDVAWRSNDPVAAAALLDEAISHLGRILQSDNEGMYLRDALSEARFELWQQQGRDLYLDDSFAGVDALVESNHQTCRARANLVRQAILSGDDDGARRVAASLLESGYYEPGFIRVCKRYAICKEGG